MPHITERQKELGTKAYFWVWDWGADFKGFLSKGSVLLLAVGLVLGTAFGAIVNSMVSDILLPLVTFAGRSNMKNRFAVLRKGGTANATYSTIDE